jgi:hypothetical protein
MTDISTGRRLPKPVVLTAAALIAGALALLGDALISGGTTRSGSSGTRHQVPYWGEGTTPESVSGQLHLEIPADATDRRAAHQKGLQDDGLLLAFTLPAAKADAFLTRLAPEQELTSRDAPLPDPAKPMTPFAHLGLTEPETLPDVRQGQVCAPCDGDLNSLWIAVHRLDAANSRVYLRGVD